MARIQSFPEGVILSSGIGGVGIQTDVEYIDVQLQNGNNVIHQERYYTDSLEVTIYDLASLIEEDMRQRGQVEAWLTLKAYTDTPEDAHKDEVGLHVLYCDRAMSGNTATFLANNFLTTPEQRRVTPFAEFMLYCCLQAGEAWAYTMDATFRIPGQDELDVVRTTVDDGDIADVAETYWIEVCLGEITHQNSSAELVSLTVTCGQRSATFYVDNALSTQTTFFFRNCFNVLDFISLDGKVVTKTEVERSSASINGTNVMYNQKRTVTYEMETAPLTSTEADWIDQLFTSHEVRIVDDKTKAWNQINITDSECEIHNGNDEMNTVKFTWRFVNNRPMLLVPNINNIFTSPYNPAFT